MSSDDWSPWRERESAGQWDREDAGQSGIRCPVCGADTGYVHKCVACGYIDPGDHEEDVQDLETSHPAFGQLKQCVKKSEPRFALAMRMRGLRTVAQAEAWLDAADDLHAAMTPSTWALIVKTWLRLRDEADAFDEPAALRQLVGAENGRAEPRRQLVAYLAGRIERLEDADQEPTVDATAEARAVATDGGVETEGCDR